MRIAINALPISNFSGKRVLKGHLTNLAEHAAGRHEFLVLHTRQQADLQLALGSHVHWIECAGVGDHWLARSAFEALRLRSVLKKLRIDRLISTSGALTPNAGVPQWVLAQNPWCFFPQFHFGHVDRLKARLQRIGYRAAQGRAEAMFYLSDFMARKYAENAGRAPRFGATTYVGVDDSVFAAADDCLAFEQRRLEILAVSVMTPHKSIEDLVDAVGRLHQRGLQTQLALVGPWSDRSYRESIVGRVKALGIAQSVEITDAVSDAELMMHYRRARVFCLLSRCESFGIPAVEAQAFGTPSVVADVCAPPEVAGPGGIVVPPSDSAAAADALHRLLTDGQAWRAASRAALANVERFRWQRVSQPMLDWLDHFDSAA